jgi:hypothetical protein
MMAIFKPGKSYIWLFAVYAAFFVGVGMVGHNITLAIISMPIMIGFILAGEIISGVALDSWWRAT